MRTARSQRGCRRNAGFTLLELTIATVIMAVALALSAGLLTESQRRFAAAAREQLDSDPGVALAMLRADLQASVGTAGGGLPGVPSPLPLILVGHPAGTVRYEVDGDDLVRTVTAPSGVPGGRLRLLHRGVLLWSEEDGVVTVRLAYPRHRGAQLRAAGSARPERAQETVATATITVTPRGGYRVQGW